MQVKESNLYNLIKTMAAVEELKVSKSNKNDFEKVTKNQQSICKHFSHILLVFMQILEMNTSKFTDGKGVAEKQSYELIQQVKSIFNCLFKLTLAQIRISAVVNSY